MTTLHVRLVSSSPGSGLRARGATAAGRAGGWRGLLRVSSLCAMAACATDSRALRPQPGPSTPQPSAAVNTTSTGTALPAAATTPAAGPASPAADGGTVLQPIAQPYADIAARILTASLANHAAYDRLAVLSDEIGPRLSGSVALTRAVSWARDEFARDAQENVELEPVRVPHWLRGAESAALIAPIAQPIQVLALGGSVATPAAGVIADVAVVTSFDELTQLGVAAQGKIVLFNHPMALAGTPGLNYGEAVDYRANAARRAAPFGAVAVLVRSVTAHSLATVHTGRMNYGTDAIKKIPAASISIEDAELIARLAARGHKVKLRLTLAAKTLPDVESANVLAEIRGKTLPEQIVLIGAHIDSWDVGRGAQDDGAGCVIVMEALAVLRRLGLQPARTLRAVLFTNEENGGRGAQQYAQDHAAEPHVAAFETDTGAGAPLGFMTDGVQTFGEEANQLARLLAPIEAASVTPGFAGEDVLPLKATGAALFGLQVDMSHYFDVHHSAADTLDKVNPEHLQRSVAALATFAYVLADRAQRFEPEPAAAATP